MPEINQKKDGYIDKCFACISSCSNVRPAG